VAFAIPGSRQPCPAREAVWSTSSARSGRPASLPKGPADGPIALLPDYLLFIALFTVGVIALRRPAPAPVPASDPQPVAA